MVTDKFRELAFSGVAVIMVVALMVASISYVRLQNAQETITTLQGNYAAAVQTNANNTVAISDLTKQVDKANQLTEQALTLAASGAKMGEDSQALIKAMYENDPVNKSYLDSALPPDIVGLFKSNASGRIPDGGIKASGNPATTVTTISAGF